MHRKTIFTLVASDHGTLIVNRFDSRPQGDGFAVGVGVELLEKGSYQAEEIDITRGLLQLRRQYYGDGVLGIDGGANIGVHAVEWGKHMTGWGQAIAIEPQERIFYALCGNLALNNCLNVCALNVALAGKIGTIPMPVPDYGTYSNFGGLSLINAPDIGQDITDWATVRTLTVDSLKLGRLDLLKLDIEGMELEALGGATLAIHDHHPILLVEHTTVGLDPLVEHVQVLDYEPFRFGQNLICVHRLDKCLDHVRHLHRTLLRRQLDVDNNQLEWVKFQRPEPPPGLGAQHQQATAAVVNAA